MIKGVIFDMDGVIIDSHPIHKAAWRRFLSCVGKPVNDSELNFILDGRKKEDILRHFLGDLSEEQIREYGRQKEKLFREEALQINLVPGIIAFLDHLHAAEIPLALASSGSRVRVQFILERLRIGGRFRVVVTGDDVIHGKPDPAIFLKAADQLGRPPSDLLVVEDAVSGIEAAKQLGMKCLAIASNGRSDLLRSAGADLVLRDFVGLSLETLQTMIQEMRLTQRLASQVNPVSSGNEL